MGDLGDGPLATGHKSHNMSQPLTHPVQALKAETEKEFPMFRWAYLHLGSMGSPPVWAMTLGHKCHTSGR